MVHFGTSSEVETPTVHPIQSDESRNKNQHQECDPGREYPRIPTGARSPRHLPSRVPAPTMVQLGRQQRR